MARITKKDIYAAHSVQFDGKHIIAPEFGPIPRLLVNGNKKIGKGVYHFSILPTNQIFTVRVREIEYKLFGSCACYCKGCYAMSGRYVMDSVKKSLAVKTWLAYNALDFVEKAINAQIAADNIKIVRVHVAGDFFSAEYVEMWKRIAINNPAVCFWTYTKVETAENAFNDIPNFNVVKSVIPGKGFNFGTCEYLLGVYEFLRNIGEKPYICRCGVDDAQHCIDCAACRTCKYVLFLEHGTDYDAKKDPLYPAFCALVLAQKSQNTKAA